MRLLAILLFFLAGLHFTLNYSTKSVIEPFVDNFDVPYNCPNLLIEKDSKFLLYNTSKLEVPGVNPIQFNNLEEYTEFVNWLRASGVKCPVLFAKQTYTTQGDKSYKICPSGNPDICGLAQNTEPQTVTPLFDAGHDKGSMPSYDPQNQYVGYYTPLDKMFHEGETRPISANPLDNNWGGPRYSEDAVNRGEYRSDQILVNNKN